ncbi:glycosyl hydrolase [Micromonospora sp. NPDC049523]|uniref:glycoside hydrolase family 26 protein n=1 Tax=Micromonospora sp. NPDC049523 TaxID=3155921 RepID=UPI0034482786
MSEQKQASRRRFRIWMVANGVVLAAITGWLLKPGTGDLPTPAAAPAPVTSVTASPSSEPTVITKEAVLALPGQHFGLSSPDVPWSSARLGELSTSAGAKPSMIMTFTKWTEEFRADVVKRSYEQGAVPIISWEPWAGIKSGTSQPAYALSKIEKGDFDPYITRFATALRDARLPVAIRFAHEMNGNWYPWSERQSGNKKGEYVRAWRHVHDIFEKVGADNAIWLWSPNILRPVPSVSISALYPGDKYVDWVGMVGYAVAESTAAPVFDPTLKALRAVTRKPVVITETGVQPGSRKVGWIQDFFRWLPKHPEVIGFVWFEYSTKDGGNADWRFTANAQTTQAFRTGVTSLKLAPAPRG